MYSQCPNNWIKDGATDNVGINTLNPAKKLSIDGNTSCADVALQLIYSGVETPYWGFFALTTPINFNQYTILSNDPTSGKGDLILSAFNAKDIILTTNSDVGKIRFATTPVVIPNAPNDIERMTIMPSGKIGISSNSPYNLFSVREPMGLDYYDGDLSFQDIRFNCYHVLPGQGGGKENTDSIKDGKTINSNHRNILNGYSAIIQARNTIGWGSLLLAVTESNLPGTELDFFESYNSPKGIMIMNFNNFANTGIGAIPIQESRLLIRGSTSDNTKNALEVSNSEESKILRVRNDKQIFVGEQVPSNNQPLPDGLYYRLSVDGQIIAKDIVVTIDPNKWSDFVFKNNYKLMSIEEVEKFILENKKIIRNTIR